MKNNLLLEFSVTNYLSFRDKATFSMEADTFSESPDNVCHSDANVDVLKTSALYGANASGKTNFIRAFTALILMVRNSDMIQVGAPIQYAEPFAFCREKDSPSSFEVIFVRNDKKYVYGVSVSSKKVCKEYLKVYNSQKPTLIFDRNNDKYTFPTSKDKSTLDMIAHMTPSNKLFLSSATTWNYSGTKEARLWFDSINTYDSFSWIKDSDLDEMKLEGNSLKPFVLKLLREADMDIDDFEVEIKEMDIDSMFAVGLTAFPNNGTQEKPKLRNTKVSMIHAVHDEDGVSRYALDFNKESSGTRSVFILAPILKDAFENTKIIIVDELERSLHPILLKYIIKLFHNPCVNKASSQLIFSTHSTDLLDSEVLRRDQIWFAEKEKESGASVLFPLSDFSVRKGENIRRGYLNNRYGGVPFVNFGEDN